MSATPALIDKVLSNLSMAVRLSLVAGVQAEQIFSHVQATIASNLSLLGDRIVEHDQLPGIIQYDQLPGVVQYDQLLGVLQYDNYLIHFSTVESGLLGLLIDQAGHVVSYGTMEKRFFLGRDQARIAIHRIRKRLAGIPGGIGWIKIVRGKGYIFLPRADLVSFSSSVVSALSNKLS